MTGSTQLVRRVLAHRRWGRGPKGTRARDNARGVDVGTMSAMRVGGGRPDHFRCSSFFLVVTILEG